MIDLPLVFMGLMGASVLAYVTVYFVSPTLEGSKLGAALLP